MTQLLPPRPADAHGVPAQRSLTGRCWGACGLPGQGWGQLQRGGGQGAPPPPPAPCSSAWSAALGVSQGGAGTGRFLPCTIPSPPRSSRDIVFGALAGSFPPPAPLQPLGSGNCSSSSGNPAFPASGGAGGPGGEALSTLGIFSQGLGSRGSPLPWGWALLGGLVGADGFLGWMASPSASAQGCW